MTHEEIKNLSDRELDALVAEKVCGWRRGDIEFHGVLRKDLQTWQAPAPPRGWSKLIWEFPDDVQLSKFDRTLPHYSTDLNDCFEAQARCIEKVGYSTYTNGMLTVCNQWRHDPANSNHDIITFAEFCLTATARQRCEAMKSAMENQ